MEIEGDFVEVLIQFKQQREEGKRWVKHGKRWKS
jgi:hypothetical protein